MSISHRMRYVELKDEGHIFIEWNKPSLKMYVDELAKDIEVDTHKPVKVIEVPEYVLDLLMNT